MQLLESLVASGRIIDIALIVMLIELIVLCVLHWRGSLAVDLLGAVWNLGAGGSLALGIKAALVNSGYLAIGACLVCSLAFHFLDTSRRLHRGQV